jgi:hypothetical protein
LRSSVERVGIANMNTTLAAQNVLTIAPQTLCYIITILNRNCELRPSNVESPIKFWVSEAAALRISSPRLRRSIRSQESAQVADGHGHAVLWFLPGEECHLCIRCQHDCFFRHRVGVRVSVIWQDQDRRRAAAHEVSRHAEHEVGVTIHL